MSNKSNDQPANRPVGKANDPQAGVKAPAPASAPAKKQETLVNGDDGISTEPKSLVGQSPISRTLGRYTILSELGRGGMGAVYLAEDSVLKRKVALKIPQFEPSKAEQFQARFLREAQMAAQLSHPNICQTFDVGVIDGQYVMAMEFIEGKTLSAFTKPEKLLSERQAVLLVKKVALAVEAAHQKGLIHRDLKPGNIMLPKPDAIRKTMEPKVMDFGLAKSMDARTTELTKSGMIVGTPCYMSKEQWSGKDVALGPQCDVYSLGIILYELLTGKLPYDVEEGEPATAWFVKLVTESQRRPGERKSGINTALEEIVMKAIAKESGDRFASMLEFASALDGWLKSTNAPKTITGGVAAEFDFGALEEPVARVRLKPSRKAAPPPRTVVIGGLAGALALIALGIILWFRSGAALVKVEVLSDDVEVTFQNETLTVKDESRDFRLTPGDQTLHIKSGNAEFDTDKFTLKKGHNPAVTVEIVKDEVVAKLGVEEILRGSTAKKDLEGTQDLASVPAAEPNSSDIDPDRAAAEWALSLPQSVGVEPIEIQLGSIVRGVSEVAELPREHFVLTRLNLAFSKGIDPRSLTEKVKLLKDLHFLRFPGEALTTELLTSLTAKASLHRLHIEDAGHRLTDSEFRIIAGINGLTYLVLTDSEVTDQGIESLASLPNLTYLALGGTHITNAGLVHLRQLPNLDALSLSDTAVTGAGLSEVSSIAKLQVLQVRNLRIVDEDLAALAKTKSLQILDLSQNPVTDNGLKHLKDLDELVSIYLSETRVTAKGAAELRKMLPNLKTVGFQDLPATTQGQDYTSPSAGMKFSLIPAGTFQMGSPDTEPERNSDEGPQHTVQISQPFYMGVYEVTQSEYAKVTGTNPSSFKTVAGQDTSRFPIETVTWYDAVEFCNTLSANDGLPTYYTLTDVSRSGNRITSATVSTADAGRATQASGQTGYRLPMEAEWEYACRAGTTTPFHFGSALNGSQANIDGRSPYGTTTLDPYLGRPTTVGSYAPNGFGLYDMHGNVWEWCYVSYADRSKVSSTETGPSWPSASSSRVARGGCWNLGAAECRSALRRRFQPTDRSGYRGFRLALSLSGQ